MLRQRVKHPWLEQQMHTSGAKNSAAARAAVDMQKKKGDQPAALDRKLVNRYRFSCKVLITDIHCCRAGSNTLECRGELTRACSSKRINILVVCNGFLELDSIDIAVRHQGFATAGNHVFSVGRSEIGVERLGRVLEEHFNREHGRRQTDKYVIPLIILFDEGRIIKLEFDRSGSR